MAMQFPDSLYSIQPPQQNQSSQPGIVQSLLNQFLGGVKTVGGSGFELGRFGLSLLPGIGDNAYVNQKTGKEVKNPFLSHKELQALSGRNSQGQITPEALGSSYLNALKKVGGTGSFFTPFGEGSVLSKFLPGAVTGGLGAASEDKATPGSIATGAVTGGLGATALAGAGSLLGKIPGLAGKAGTALENTATQKTLNTSPAVYDKALQETGLDVNNIFNKYFKGETNVSNIIGNPAKKGAGGQLGDLLNNAETRLQNTIKIAGSNVKVSAQEFVKELQNQRKLLAKIPGNEDKISQLDAFIQNTKDSFGQGKTFKQLLDLKRAADSKFGAAVADEQAGSVAAQGQKVLANTARAVLKKIFPEAQDALNTQSELLTLKPILSRAFSKGQVATTGTGGFSLGTGLAVAFNPLLGGSLFAAEKAANSPAVLNKAGGLLNKVGNLGGKGVNPAAGYLLNQGASRAGSLLSGMGENNGNQISNYNNGQYNPQNDLLSTLGGNTSSINGGVNSQGLDPQRVALAMLAYPKYASLIGQIASLYKSPVSAQSSQQVASQQVSALTNQALQQLSQGVNTGQIGGRLESFLGNLGLANQNTLDFQTTISNLKATLAKARAGTSFTPNEEALLNKYTPNITDSKQQLLTKLRGLEQLFNTNAIGTQASQSPQIDTNSLLQLLGGQ